MMRRREANRSLLKLMGATAIAIATVACSDNAIDPRGVDHDETLLSVSATGQVETRPDRAEFQAGINSWGKTAETATEANQAKIDQILTALKRAGIAEKDIQSRAISVQRLDWGDRRGQYQASNVVNVTVRKVDNAGQVLAAVTAAGANVLNGPEFRMTDPEQAANLAYASAYKAARKRAEAYGTAADMTISRVLSIRDAGGMQGNRYLPGAVPAAPPPPVLAEQSASNATSPLMPGQTSSSVSIQVDFALRAK